MGGGSWLCFFLTAWQGSHSSFAGLDGVGPHFFFCGIWLEYSCYCFKIFLLTRLPLSWSCGWRRHGIVGTCLVCTHWLLASEIFSSKSEGYEENENSGNSLPCCSLGPVYPAGLPSLYLSVSFMFVLYLMCRVFWTFVLWIRNRENYIYSITSIFSIISLSYWFIKKGSYKPIQIFYFFFQWFPKIVFF